MKTSYVLKMVRNRFLFLSGIRKDAESVYLEAKDEYMSAKKEYEEIEGEYNELMDFLDAVEFRKYLARIYGVI